MAGPTPGLMIGVGLTGVGLLGAYGSITGNLPSMIAALFYPSLLTVSSDAGPTNTNKKKPAAKPKPGNTGVAAVKGVAKATTPWALWNDFKKFGLGQ